MRIIYTNHALEKFRVLEELGWKITRTRIKKTVQKPRWRGISRHGQETAMGLVNTKHIIRVIFDRENDTIKVITFHIARRGKYKTSL